MAHTPGKWEAVEVGDSGGDNPIGVYEVIADGHVRVAEYLSEADAKLVALAPAMRNALIDALEVLENYEDIADETPDGRPIPNKAMQMAMELRALLGERP